MRNLNKDEEESYIKGLEKISIPTGYKIFEDNVNYDELLKYGYSKGLADGLIMVISILSNLERKAKRKINNK